MQKYNKYLIIALALVCLFFIVKNELNNKKHASEITKLHNELASTLKTSEIHKNLYMSKSLELEDVSKLLDETLAINKTDKKVIRDLQKDLDRKNEQVLSALRLAMKWKKAYESEANSNQEELPGENGTIRKKVSFSKDFGYITASGYTMTDPSYAYVKVEQNRPLMLTIALTQDKNGSWKTYVGSSEENIEVNVDLSAVNPFILKDKWYEKLQLASSLSIDSNSFITSIGMAYDFGSFVIGPSAFATNSNDSVNISYGMTMSWKPFKR